MKGFKHFFVEAKVSEKRLEKVVDIFLRLMKRKLKTSEFYRFGGPKGIVDIKGGKGMLYFYDKKKAIRFNYVDGELSSVSLWNDFKLGKKAKYTVDFSNTGLLQSAKKLIDIFQNPSPGTYEYTPNPFINEAIENGKYSVALLEAKRVKPYEFFNLVNLNLPAGADITNLLWDDLSSIADDADVQVPGKVRSTKVKGTKGATARFDISQLEDVTKSGSSEPTVSINVKSGDSRTSTFMAAGGEGKVSQGVNAINGAIHSPNVKTEMANPDSLFGIMKNLVQLVCRKSRNSLVIYGGPGTGKTYTVTETVKDEGLEKGDDYFIIKGRVTTASLYQTLYLHRGGSLLIFDDTDSVWKDKEAGNILKAALDSYDERIISWLSGRTVNVSKMSQDDKDALMAEVDAQIDEDPGNQKIKLPSEFDFQGRIIFISNLKYEQFDSAVLTRSAKIDMSLTDAQMFTRIESIIAHLGDSNVSLKVKGEILDFLKEQNRTGELREPSMRTFVAAEDTYKSGLPNWRDLLAYL
jgi:hypothetical protein